MNVKKINAKNAVLEVAADFGGVLTKLQLFDGQQTVDLIDGYTSIEAATSKKYAKSHWLLPFPNRLNKGSYTFNQKTYQFPINDVQNGHNLHGFSNFLPTTINTITQNSLEVTTIFNETAYFPFPFKMIVTYTLQSNAVFIQTTIINIGNTLMPIGVGWHPYFQLNHVLIDDLKLKLPSCKKIQVDNRMLPTGQQFVFEDFKQLKYLNNTLLDNCFLIKNTSSEAQIILEGQHTRLIFSQETGDKKFNYFQIFTPDHRRSIAIEPMTCNIDAFNNKEGLIYLESNEQLILNCKIQVESTK